ncbi:MAG: hypothetical protein ACKO4Q_05715 [Planctomycetota bacterium]
MEHKLGLEGAVGRFQELARQHGLKLQSSDGGHSGTLEKKLPFVGVARGRFHVTDTAVEIAIDSAPSFPGPETIRRMVSEELAKALA